MDDVKKERTDEIRASRPRLEKLKPDKPTHKQPQQIRQQVTAGEKEALRYTGIDILGNVHWGTHFCLFYHTKQDLIDILVPYFKAGLENNEFCMWVTSEPLNAEDAKQALKHAVRNLDAYINKGQIEILDYSDWYTKSGAFEPDSILQGWVQKHDQAVKNGFDGLRATGNTLWIEKKDWAKFTDYEAVVNSVIGKYKMLAVCTYSLDKCGASEILDVEHNHQFALLKWRGDWKILESSSKNQLEAKLAEQTAIAQALQRSKKDWVKTFNAMSDWVALIDLKGRILRTNRAGENFTGKTLDEIIGQSCCKLVHGSDKHIPGCPLRIMLHTRQQTTMELNVPNTDRWLMVTTDPVMDEKNNIIGAVHITRDITERKKDEKALQESEKRYKYLFEKSPLGIGLSTPDGRVVRANKAMEVTTGYFEEELKKINLTDLYENTKDRKKLLETLERYGCAVDSPTRLKRKDGTVFDALLNVSRVHLAGQDLFQTIYMDVSEQKKAEQALKESEARLSVVFEKVPAVLLLVDSDRRVHLVNEAAARFAKRTADEMTGLRGGDALRCLHSLDDPKGCGYGPFCDICVVRNTVLETFKAGRGFLQREAQLPFDIDGKTVELSLLVSTATLKVSGRQMVLVCLENITERKKAQEELRRSEKQASAAIEAARGFTFNYDIATGKVKWGGAIEAITGYTPEEFAQVDVDGWAKMIHPDDRDRVLSVLQKAIHQLDRATAEYRFRIKNGGYVTLSSISLTEKKDGKAVRLVGILQDITERKKAEEALQESEEHYRMLAERMNDGLGAIDENGRYVYVNNKLGEILGYSPDEMMGRHWTAFYDEDAQKIIKEQLVKRKKGVVEPYEVINTRRDGQKIWIRISPQAIFDAEGNFKGSFGILTDLTKHKKAEQQVESLAKFPSENPNPVLRITKNGKVLYSNEAGKLLLAKWKSGVGKTVPEKWRNLIAEAFESEKGRAEEEEEEEEVKDKVFALTIAPVKDAGYANLYARDITEHKKAAEQIENLAKFPSENPYPVLRIARDGTVLYANEASTALLRDRKSGPGQPAPREWRQLAEEVLNSGSVERREVEHVGRIFAFHAVPVIDAGYVNFYGVDITERKKAEQKLFDYQAQLKTLASQLTLAEERERHRIAADLHDHVSQSLAFSKMKLEALRIAESSPETERVLGEVSDLLGQTIDNTKSLTFDLSSPVLNTLGFEAAVADWLTEQIEQKHGIKVEFEDDQQPKTLDDDIRMLLFRNVRELLINVAKHAQASKVKVSISKAGSQIQISVEDDGVGFDPAEAALMAARRAEFGLFSIRERLEELAGHLEIKSAPGHGCRVTMMAPLKEENITNGG